jgi:hypothetical protein
VKNRDMKEIMVVEYSGSKRFRSQWVCDHVMMAQLDVLETVGRISPISKHQVYYVMIKKCNLKEKQEYLNTEHIRPLQKTNIIIYTSL